MFTLTTVLPVFNEERRLPETVAALSAFAAKNPHLQLVVVDDGSTDATPQILARHLSADLSRNPAFLRFEQNSGKGGAIRRAWASFPGQHFAYTDGDLAYSLEYLKTLEKSLETHDVVIGSRSVPSGDRRATSLRRRVLGWGFNRLARFVLGLPYPDTQAGLKAFRAEAAARLFSRQRIRNFGFDVELLYLARKLGLKVAQIPAVVEPGHTYKTSKLKLLRDSLKMLSDLGQIRFNDWRGLYDEQDHSAQL